MKIKKATMTTFLVLGAVLLLTASAPSRIRIRATLESPATNGGGRQDKAAELVKQAKEALGGEAAIDALTGLSLSGSFQRSVGDSSMSGQVQMLFSFPDKFKMIETTEVAGGAVELDRIEAVDGEYEWRDFQTSGGGGGNIVIRKAPEKAGGDQPSHPISREFARQALGLLMKSVATFPLKFTYAGEGEFGDSTAEVLDATGPEGFSVRLFLDSSTHRPLLMTYRAVPPRMTIRRMGGGGGQSREEMEKAADEAAKHSAPPEEKEFQVKFGDYRQVEGLYLPFQVTQAIEGKVSEELTVKQYRLNPTFKPDEFKKKK